MEKVLRITTLKAKESDFLFWQSKTEKERLEAVELLRQQYIKFTKDAQPRLQRVCRIITQTQG
jgi:hypothetical protein